MVSPSLGSRGDFELGGKTFVGHDERVIAGAGHRGRDVCEDRLTVVGDLAGLAVHELGCADDVTSEGCADGLVAEADAEESGCAGLRWRSADEVDADAGVLRGAGAGGDEDAVGVQVFDLLWGQFVVATNDHLLAELANVLDEVVGEGVVVVEDEDHGVLNFPLAATGVLTEEVNDVRLNRDDKRLWL